MENKGTLEIFNNYGTFLREVKNRIKVAQVKANFAANRELIILYWRIGKMVTSVQKITGWGQGIIPRLAKDIKNELPEVKGFSERNIGRMRTFFQEYEKCEPFLIQSGSEESKNSILPQPVAKLEERSILITELPWGHN